MLDSAQRKYLKGLAHKLEPMVLIGKASISDQVFREISVVLDSHELVKMKFNDFKAERKDLSKELAERLNAELVQIIGNIAVIYRANPKTEKSRIRLPKPRKKEE